MVGKNNTLDYLILTHANNISLFVWTHNFDKFMSLYNDQIMDTLREWKYTGSYKTPLLSFNSKSATNLDYNQNNNIFGKFRQFLETILKKRVCVVWAGMRNENEVKPHKNIFHLV